jgi:hypothetical protein
MCRRVAPGLALVILSCIAGVGAQNDVPSADARIEAFLLEGRLVKSREAGKGVTNSMRVTLTDGTLTHDAHVQTVDQYKREFDTPQGRELDFRDSWRFNIAAYRIDRLIGLNMVPVSVERRFQNQPAAYTWWVDDVLMDEGTRAAKNVRAPDQQCWNEQVWMVRVFDQLIDNTDRNLGNLLIGKDWRVWAIDHTRAFRYATEPRAPAILTRTDRRLLERLKALDFPTLEREIGQYVTDADIRRLLARRDGIVAHFDRLGSAGLFDRQNAGGGCRTAAE